jgi:hypothetical protein|tara:strand:- start:166 stop:642 length:477 start_codon:yes stop_codon:yes gene_type:complete
MIDETRLCKFLAKAKKATYAAGDSAKKIAENDKSTTLVFEDGDLKYHDNYFGGEPFGGREVVFHKNEPIYIMVYYGLVDESTPDFKAVYKFLQKALLLIPEDRPFRGPDKFTENDLTYTNSCTGEIGNFFGEETIMRAGKEIYKARYSGGFVDIRKEE